MTEHRQIIPTLAPQNGPATVVSANFWRLYPNGICKSPRQQNMMAPRCRHRASLDDVMRLIAELKKDAKARSDGICAASHVDILAPA